MPWYYVQTVKGQAEAGAVRVVEVPDIYYKRRRRYFDTNGLEIYACRNTLISAALADATWHVWRRVYDANGLEVDVQGPLIGAVDNAAACAALSWPALT